MSLMSKLQARMAGGPGSGPQKGEGGGSDLSSKEHKAADRLDKRMKEDAAANDRDNKEMGGDIQGPDPADYQDEPEYEAWAKKYGDEWDQSESKDDKDFSRKVQEDVKSFKEALREKGYKGDPAPEHNPTPEVGTTHVYHNPGHPMDGHYVQVTKVKSDGSIRVRSHTSSDRRKSDGSGPVIRSVTITNPKKELKAAN